MKLKEALEILKNTGYNIRLTEAQFTDRVMQDAMEDDMFLGADEYEERERAMDDANALIDGEQFDEAVKAFTEQYQQLHETANELVEHPAFSEIDPNVALWVCRMAAANDEDADKLYADYYDI